MSSSGSGSSTPRGRRQSNNLRYSQTTQSAPPKISRSNAGIAHAVSNTAVNNPVVETPQRDGRRLCDLLPKGLLEEFNSEIEVQELLEVLEKQLLQWDNRGDYTKLDLGEPKAGNCSKLLRDLKNPRNHKEFNEWLSKTFRSLTQMSQADKQRPTLEDQLLEARDAIALLPLDTQSFVEWPKGSEKKLENIEQSRVAPKNITQIITTDRGRHASPSSSQRSNSASRIRERRTYSQPPPKKKQMQPTKTQTGQEGEGASTFLLKVKSKENKVRPKDLKEDKKIVAAECVYEHRHWIKRQELFFRWTESPAPAIIVVKTKVEETEQSPVTLVGKEYVQSHLNGDRKGIAMFLMPTAMRDMSLEDIYAQLFSQLVNDGRIQKKTRENGIDNLVDVIAASKGNFDPARWLRHLCFQILNHFEVVFWIDSIQVFEGDDDMKFEMDCLIRTLIDLAEKAKTKFPLRILITCPSHSAMVDGIQSDSKLIRTLEVPSAEAFKAKSLALQHLTTQASEIADDVALIQPKVKGKLASDDPSTKTSNYKRKRLVESVGINTSSVVDDLDPETDQTLFDWWRTLAKRTAAKETLELVARAPPPADARSAEDVGQDRDIKLVGIQWKFVDVKRREFLARNDCLSHLREYSKPKAFDLSDHYGYAREGWMASNDKIRDWILSDTSSALILQCFEPHETRGSPLTTLVRKLWQEHYPALDHILMERLGFAKPHYTPTDIVVDMMHHILTRTWDLELPLPEGFPKLEELIKALKDCIWKSLSRGAVIVHLHGFSIYEDNIDNIKGLYLLQSTLGKLTQQEGSKYPLKLLISNSAPSKIAARLKKETDGIPVVEVPNIEQWERDHLEDVPVAPPVPPKTPLD